MVVHAAESRFYLDTESMIWYTLGRGDENGTTIKRPENKRHSNL